MICNGFLFSLRPVFRSAGAAPKGLRCSSWWSSPRLRHCAGARASCRRLHLGRRMAFTEATPWYRHAPPAATSWSIRTAPVQSRRICSAVTAPTISVKRKIPADVAHGSPEYGRAGLELTADQQAGGGEGPQSHSRPCAGRFPQGNLHPTHEPPAGGISLRPGTAGITVPNRQGCGSRQKKGPENFRALMDGGEEEDRTPDLCIANAALSQLSYPPETGGILASAAWASPRTTCFGPPRAAAAVERGAVRGACRGRRVHVQSQHRRRLSRALRPGTCAGHRVLLGFALPSPRDGSIVHQPGE